MAHVNVNLNFYDNHETWCDTQNNISNTCNCLASGYIEEIESIKAKLEVAKKALEKYGLTDFVLLCEETKEYHIEDDIKRDLNCPWRFYSGEIARQALKELEK